MYFMAQKRLNGDKLFAFLDDKSISDSEDYEKSFKAVYPLMLEQWQKHPEKWVTAVPIEVSEDSTNWDFALFVIDKLPGSGLEINTLGAKYYFTH